MYEHHHKIAAVALTLCVIASSLVSASVTTRLYPRQEHYWTGRMKAMDHGYSKHNHTMFFRGHVPDTAWHSWAKFDLSALPDSSTIENAKFVYRVSSIVKAGHPPAVPKEGPYTYVRLVEHDPVTTEGRTLWLDLTEGTIVSPGITHDKGWIERPLNATGLQALEDALEKDWIALSLHKFDTVVHRYGVAHGYAGANAPYIEITYDPPYTGPDPCPIEITQPELVIEPFQYVTPEGIFKNIGEVPASFESWFIMSSGNVELYREMIFIESLPPSAETTICFPRFQVGTISQGIWYSRCSTYMFMDPNVTNNEFEDWFFVPETYTSVGFVGWNAPEGWLDTAIAYQPEVRIRSLGNFNAPFTTWFIMDSPEGEVYRHGVEVAGLAPHSDTTLQFPDYFVGDIVGDWVARCSLDVPYDTREDDNYAVSWFSVAPRGMNVTWGWKEVPSIPAMPTPKPVKKGGWLAYNPGNGYVYIGKGNKTTDFYCYNPLFRQWRTLASIQLATDSGIPAKPPAKGAKAVSDGGNYLYMTRGNNTLDFLRYDIMRDAWERLADVPAGGDNKRIKGGNDMVYVAGDDGDYIYLLKGMLCDFYRYDVSADLWEPMDNAPAGLRPKWGRGSWLVYDGQSTIYAHKAKEHEMWAYDLATGDWGYEPLNGMPIMVWYGDRIRNKKSKDGSSADWYDGQIYALKGGNTGEFFRYTPEGNAWEQLDPMPEWGTTCKKKRVKHGADFVTFAPGRSFFALKGNKTREFWTYIMPPAESLMARTPDRSGVMAGVQDLGRLAVTIVPNPPVGKAARVHYTLPTAAPATISVFDVTGREITRQALAARRSGSVSLPLAGMNAGVYLVRLDAYGCSATRKLVVHH